MLEWIEQGQFRAIWELKIKAPMLSNGGIFCKNERPDTVQASKQLNANVIVGTKWKQAVLLSEATSVVVVWFVKIYVIEKAWTFALF